MSHSVHLKPRPPTRGLSLRAARHTTGRLLAPVKGTGPSGFHRFDRRNFGSNSRYAVTQTTTRATISTGTQSFIFPSRLSLGQ